MRVAVFSTRQYDRVHLDRANERAGHELVYFEQWGKTKGTGDEALKAALREAQETAATHRRFVAKSR